MKTLEFANGSLYVAACCERSKMSRERCGRHITQDLRILANNANIFNVNPLVLIGHLGG